MRLFGTLGEWDIEGLVEVLSNLVGSGCKLEMHWVSKVVEAVAEAAGRRVGIKNICHIAR